MAKAKNGMAKLSAISNMAWHGINGVQRKVNGNGEQYGNENQHQYRGGIGSESVIIISGERKREKQAA
jgi:hypothetical protein